MKTQMLFVSLALVAVGAFAQTPRPGPDPIPTKTEPVIGIHVGNENLYGAPQSHAYAPPAPPAKLQELKYFAGTWRCAGSAFATDFGPAHPTKAHVTATWDLNSNWLLVRYAEETTDSNPKPYAVAAYWGWDEGSKSFTNLTVDDKTGFSTGNSPGWNGDVLVFTGPSHWGPTTSNARDTFTKMSNNELKHLGEVQVKGAWVKLDEETCKK